MSPYRALPIDQERIEQNDAAFCDWAAMGAEDARAGEPPNIANDAYLAGYIQAIKELPVNPDGTIARPTEKHFHHSPAAANEF